MAHGPRASANFTPGAKNDGNLRGTHEPRPQICDRVARTGKLPYKSHVNHGPSQKKQRHRAQTEPLRKKDGPASWALAGWVPESSIVLPFPVRAARNPKVDGKTRHFGYGGRLFPARCADFGPKAAIWPEIPCKKPPGAMVFWDDQPADESN